MSAHREVRAGTVESRPIDVYLGQILDAALEAPRSAGRSQGPRLSCRFDPTLRVYVDPLLTRTAIQNLADNAVKYTDDGQVGITVDELAETFLVHVRDTCEGITEDEVRTIFEPFERGRNHQTGTGLGLAIAKDAVEAQGGSIHVESHGRGCHFWIALPKFGQMPEETGAGSSDHGAHSPGQ